MSAAANRQAIRHGERGERLALDAAIWIPALFLAAFGVVMVASSSVAIAERAGVAPFSFVARHLMFLACGAGLGAAFYFAGSQALERVSRPLALLAVLLLLLPLLPGIGVEINGARRWINLGLLRFQVVEAVKLLLIVTIAGYLARQRASVRGSFWVTLKPLLLGAVLAALLLKQPDMGSALVLLSIAGGMVLLAGAPWRHLLLPALGSLPLLTMAALEPYRWARLTTFVAPEKDPTGDGYQLLQALIAVGRGELFGVGLGASIQKLFYLPEAHNDFIFAVVAEELGLAGVVAVLAAFAVLVGRILLSGLAAERLARPFSAFVLYGIGLWLGLQVLISSGVNLGVLPTTGLTLPLISTGGSSMVMVTAALGLALRLRREIDDERLAVPRRRVWA